MVQRQTQLVLVVEDEPEIAGIIAAYLERDFFRVLKARDGEEALRFFRTQRPDIVLLDIGLPLRDGMSVLEAIRLIDFTPVIMMTALGTDTAKLTGFSGGADDYIVKPFNPPELVARVHAVLRRIERKALQKPLRFRSLELDQETCLLSFQENEETISLPVSVTQMRLLAMLIKAAPRIMSRMQLVEACLSGGEALERTIDSHISKMRKKMEEIGVPYRLEAVRGVGYRLTLP